MQVIKSYDKETGKWVAINVIDQVGNSGSSGIDESQVNQLIDNKLTTVNSDISSIKSKNNSQDTSISNLENRVKSLEDKPAPSTGLNETQVNNLIDNKLSSVNTKNNSQDASISTLNNKVSTLESNYNELFTSASNGKELVANAITGKGVYTSSSDTFATMADNIKKIETSSGGSSGGTIIGNEQLSIATSYPVTNWLIYNTKNNPISVHYRAVNALGTDFDSSALTTRIYNYTKEQNDNNYFSLSFELLTEARGGGDPGYSLPLSSNESEIMPIADAGFTVPWFTAKPVFSNGEGTVKLVEAFVDIYVNKNLGFTWDNEYFTIDLTDAYFIDNALNNMLNNLLEAYYKTYNKILIKSSNTDTPASEIALQHATEMGWLIVMQ